jgi:hypothetical protein
MFHIALDTKKVKVMLYLVKLVSLETGHEEFRTTVECDVRNSFQ